MAHEITHSEIFALLSNQRRRLLLQLLPEDDTPLSEIELAKRIGDCVYDTPSPSDLRNIQLSLYHIHLPKLEEAGVVEYNDRAGTVQPGRNFATLLHFLEHVSEEDTPPADG